MDIEKHSAGFGCLPGLAKSLLLLRLSLIAVIASALLPISAFCAGEKPSLGKSEVSYHGESLTSNGNRVILAKPGGFLAVWRVPAREILLKAWIMRLKPLDSINLAVWTRQPNGLGKVRVLRWGEGQWLTIAHSSDRPIWHLEIGDVNGDGRDEIIAGLWQRSKLDPNVARRVYVYGVDAKRRSFVPLWRGSALSRPFRDIRLVKCGTKCDLAAIESQHNYPECEWISLYKWDEFGFRRIWDSPVMGNIVGWGNSDSIKQGEALWLDRAWQGKRERIEVSASSDGVWSSRRISKESR